MARFCARLRSSASPPLRYSLEWSCGRRRPTASECSQIAASPGSRYPPASCTLIGRATTSGSTAFNSRDKATWVKFSDGVELVWASVLVQELRARCILWSQCGAWVICGMCADALRMYARETRARFGCRFPDGLFPKKFRFIQVQPMQ